MAIIRCTECRKDVSDKAASCPNCGAPVDAAASQALSAASGMRAVKWVAAIVALLVIVNICSPDDATTNRQQVPAAAVPLPPPPPPKPVPDEAMLAVWSAGIVDETLDATLRERYAQHIIRDFDDRPEATAAKDALPKLSALVADERSNGRWNYRNSEDGMSGKRTGYAAVRSDNTINLDFPYHGDQHGTLAVRRHPSFGNDVILSIEKGQILCRSRDCPVRIRYDDAAPVTYSGTEPADNSSDTVFLPYAVATQLKSAKRVRVEINLYQNGIRVLEFNVKGFDPDKMKEQK